MERKELNNIFRILLTLVSGEGREEKLFGSQLSLAEETFDRALCGKVFPMVYLEIPLIGKPCYDLGVGYGEKLCSSNVFPEAKAFGYRKALDYFAANNNVGFGFSIDLSRGETERAGLYLQHRGNYKVIEPFLRACGDEERYQNYMNVSDRIRKSWPSSYIGFFPERPGSPTRLGGYITGNPDLMDLFKLSGFTSYGSDMMDLCRELTAICEPEDYQFDIRSDGTLSDEFGLSFSFAPQRSPKMGAESLRSGKGARFMTRLQELKLIDDRWNMIPDALFARTFPLESENGNKQFIALTVSINMVKIKFKAGIPQGVKFYLALESYIH